MVEGKSVDFCPRIPILMQFAAKYVGKSYGEFTSNHEVLVSANLRCADAFGLDQVSTISDPYRETSALGGDVVIDDVTGPQCLIPPLAGEYDLRIFNQPDFLRSPRVKDRIDAVANYAARVANKFSILGWVEGPAALACDLRGMENLFVDLMEDEEPVDDLLDNCVDVALAFARAQIDAGADTIGIGDAAASQMSADLYTKFILPREKRLVAGIRKMGAWTRLHICGNISHLLPGISTLGVNILDVDHLVDLSDVRGVVGNEVVLAGNLDPVRDVMQGVPDRIEALVKECYQSSGGRYAVNAGCEIPSDTPIENLNALCSRVN